MAGGSCARDVSGIRIFKAVRADWFTGVVKTVVEDGHISIKTGYGQRIYQSGYTYYGRIIGHGLDNDARVISAGVVVMTDAGNSWQLLGRAGDLNKVGRDEDHTVAIEPQDLMSFDIQHSRHTKIGRFDIGVGYEEREIKATGNSADDTRAFIRWTSR